MPTSDSFNAKKMKNITIYSLLLLVLISCEGTKFITGTVISNNTGEPIENVEINVLNKMGDSTFTDTNGKYKLQSGFIGMMFGGPKFKFEVKKKGFESLIIKTKWGQDTIKLKSKK